MKYLVSLLLLFGGAAYSAGTQKVIVLSGSVSTSAMTSSVTCSTSYIVSATTSPTGLGTWIDCTGAKKVVFQFKIQADTDAATPTDTGTFYIDSSLQLNTFLGTQSFWNCTYGGIQYQTAASALYTVSDPPRSLRWRITGSTRNTNSVSYQICY